MSMTDEQIIEALAYCTSKKSCEECPICNTDNCGFVLMQNALDLIKRQQAEIENLKADKEAIINGQLTLQKMYLECRDKTVREFAEFLIDKAENNVIRIGDLCDYVIDFNEMTEKEGGKG